MSEMDEQWAAVESAVAASRREGGLDLVHESPLRSGTVPLPYELVMAFVGRFRESADGFLRSKLTHADPVVVGYALFALDQIEAPLRDAAAALRHRTEPLWAGAGCFGWRGTLAEYAERLAKDD